MDLRTGAEVCGVTREARALEFAWRPETPDEPRAQKPRASRMCPGLDKMHGYEFNREFLLQSWWTWIFADMVSTKGSLIEIQTHILQGVLLRSGH